MASAKVKPSLHGLQNALAPETLDPLGIDRKRRGMEAYYAEARKSDPNYMSGPLPDPEWEGYGQALADAGVTKVGMDAGRPNGIADNPEAPGWAAPPIDRNTMTGQELLNEHLMQSNNVAGAQPVSQTSLALEGLSQAALDRARKERKNRPYG